MFAIQVVSILKKNSGPQMGIRHVTFSSEHYNLITSYALTIELLGTHIAEQSYLLHVYTSQGLSLTSTYSM